jgi:hypothetical protein
MSQPEPERQEVEIPMEETKNDPSLTPETTAPGYKTLSFYATLVLTVCGALAASGSDIGGLGAVGFLITSLSAAGYTAFRAFKKSETPSKPAWKTTEFYLSIAAGLVSAVYASGVFAETSRAGQVVALVATLLAALGYTVKPKK